MPKRRIENIEVQVTNRGSLSLGAQEDGSWQEAKNKSLCPQVQDLYDLKRALVGFFEVEIEPSFGFLEAERFHSLCFIT